MSNNIDASVAKRLDITVKENQTLQMSFSFFDEGDNPLDLTGASFKMSVREDSSCTSACGCDSDSFNQTFKQDITPTSAGPSSIQINEVIKLAHGTYKYDLLAEFPDQGRTYLLQGNFKVKKSYTQITQP